MTRPPVTTFSSAGVRRGFLQGQPLAPGAFIYGMVFGVLASERGLAWLEALLMSVWESEEDAIASADFARGALERFGTLFRSPPGRERYEVRFAELPDLVAGEL